jgi:hypothetical protein
VNRRDCILVGALPDHESAIAEMEFSDGAARVELCESHGPEELPVGGHGEMSLVRWPKMEVKVVPERDGDHVVHVEHHHAVRVDQGHVHHYSKPCF